MWDALASRSAFLPQSATGSDFSLIVIVTLALAVGATTAVGSLLNALVLRTLAVPSPEQLVALSPLIRGRTCRATSTPTRSRPIVAPSDHSRRCRCTPAEGACVSRRSGVFDAVTETVSPSYFDLVSARPSAGRFFSESDEAVVVFSEGFRRRVFGMVPASARRSRSTACRRR